MPFDAEDNLFLLPGPVKIHPRILRAQAVPALGHRTPEFREVLRRLTRGLRYLFQSKETVLALTGSATMGMEAVVSNLVGQGDRIAVVENGKFGERFTQLGQLYAGDGAVVVRSAYGAPADLGALEAALAKKDVKAVAFVINESSTGVENPTQRIADLCKQYGAFCLADGVTAVGGIDVPVDKWGLDACVVGSQKCLGAPPGVTLLSLSKRYLEAAKSPSLFMDLKLHAAKWAEEETPFTPATHLFLACAEALDMLAEETLEKRVERTAKLAHAFRLGLAALNLRLLPEPSSASNTISAVRYPEGVQEKDVREVLKREYGIVVAGGQGDLKGKIFRAAHMGYAQARELAALVAALDHVLARAGHSFTRGAPIPAFWDAFK